MTLLTRTHAQRRAASSAALVTAHAEGAPPPPPPPSGQAARPSKAPAEKMIKARPPLLLLFVTSRHLFVLLQDEKREEGSVKKEVYTAYARALPGGWWAVAGLFGLNVAKQACAVCVTIVLAEWSGASVDGSRTGHYLALYTSLSLAVAVLTYVKSLAFTYCGIAAAGKLHNALMGAVLGVRLVFFDVTPLGRVLQRFSKDTDTLDNTLPAAWNSTTEFVVALLSVSAWPRAQCRNIHPKKRF